MEVASIKKWCAAITAIVIGIVHVSFLTLYLLPPNPFTNSYREIVQWYIDPIFQQNWKLFAPDPQPYSLKVFYQCAGDKDWRDPVASVLEAHQKYRITYHGKLLYVYNGLIRNLLNTKYEFCKNDPNAEDCINPVSNKQILDDVAFRKMKFFISHYCPDERFTFRVARVYSIKFSERSNLTAKRKILYDEYQVN